MVKTRKPKVAGVLNMVSGFILGMVSFGAFMDVINAGKFEMAWWILLIIPGMTCPPKTAPVLMLDWR